MLIGDLCAGFCFVRYLAMDVWPEFLHHDRDGVQGHLRSPGVNGVRQGSIGANELVGVGGSAQERAPGMIAIG